QNAKLQSLSLVLRCTSGRQFLPQVANRADTLAVDRRNDVTCFESRLFRRRAGIHAAHQNPFAVGGSEESAQLAVQIFRVDAKPRLGQESPPIKFRGRERWEFRQVRDGGEFRHVKGEGPGGAGRRRKIPERMAPLFGFAKSDAYG